MWVRSTGSASGPVAAVVGVVDGAAPVEPLDLAVARASPGSAAIAGHGRAQRHHLVVGRRGSRTGPASPRRRSRPGCASARGRRARSRRRCAAPGRRSRPRRRTPPAPPAPVAAEERSADHAPRVQDARSTPTFWLGACARVLDEVVLLHLAAQVEEDQRPGGQHDVERERQREQKALRRSPRRRARSGTTGRRRAGSRGCARRWNSL